MTTAAAAPTQPKPVLTLRQQCVLDAIRGYIEREGMPPTRNEIAKLMGFTVNGAEYYVQLLVKKGVLEHTKRISRGIRVS